MRAVFKSVDIFFYINYNNFMPLLDYKCKNCKKVFSELVRSYDQPVFCPDCKTLAERVYFGEVSGPIGKKSVKCNGDCKNCSGCG